MHGSLVLASSPGSLIFSTHIEKIGEPGDEASLVHACVQVNLLYYYYVKHLNCMQWYRSSVVCI